MYLWRPHQAHVTKQSPRRHAWTSQAPPATHLHDRRCPLRTGMSGHRANADTAPRSSSDIWVQNKRNQLADGGWWGRRVRLGSNTDGRDCAVTSQSTYGASIHDGGSSCNEWQRRGGNASQLFTHPQHLAWYDDNARGAGPRRGHATGRTVGCPAFLRQSCCSRLRRVARQRRETRIVPPTKEGATLVRGCLATSVICCSRHVSDKRAARHTRQ